MIGNNAEHLNISWKSVRLNEGLTGEQYRNNGKPDKPPKPPTPPEEDKRKWAAFTVALSVLFGTLAFAVTSSDEILPAPYPPGSILYYNVTKAQAISNQWGQTAHRQLAGALGTDYQLVARKSTNVMFLSASIISFNYTNMTGPQTFQDARLEMSLESFSFFGYMGIPGGLPESVESVGDVSALSWPPSFTSEPVRQAAPGEPYSYTPTVNESNVVWSFVSTASWLHFSSSNHTVWGRAQGVGSFIVTVRAASMTGGMTASQTWTLYVVAPFDYGGLVDREFPVALYEVKGYWKDWSSVQQTDGVTWQMIKDSKLVVDRNPVDVVRNINRTNHGYGVGTYGNVTFDISTAVNDWIEGTWFPQWGFLVAIIAPWETTDYPWFSLGSFKILQVVVQASSVQMKIGVGEVIPEFGDLVIPLIGMGVIVLLVGRRRKGS